MFVQVIEGRTDEKQAVHEAFDRWTRDLAGDAPGWLGTTAGVTDDGRFIAVARFENEEDARRNSARPEQDSWWSDLAQHLAGEASFHDSTDVVLDLVGDPDQAGFVQVMHGASRDPDRARDLMSQGSEQWADFRPDIIGSLAALEGDGSYTMAVYFTSEADARAGEAKEPPPELKEQMGQLDSLSAGKPEFFDLKDPWLYTRS